MTTTTTDTHEPVTFLNRSGSGIRTYIACTCGWAPKKMPQSGSTMHLAIQAHDRKNGIRRPNYAGTIFGEGPATGMTWNEWYAKFPGQDPFGERD